MGLTLLAQSAATAASVGMGCGTCCGSGMGVVLSGYLMTHARNFAASLRGFLMFYLGKIMAVMALCGAASLAGNRIIGEDGMIFGIPVRFAVDAVMLGMGIWFLIRWILEQKGHSTCHHCDHRESAETSDGKVSLPALWGMGVGYGISPCAPLLMMAGYAAMLPLGAALAVGAVFALCSAVSPMLILLLVTGALSGRMYREIPQYLRWFRLGCYLLVIVFFAIDMIGML